MNSPPVTYQTIMLVIHRLLILSCFTSIFARQLPSFVQRCRRNDPKIDDCLKQALISIQPHAQKGIPEMKLVQIEPFRIDRVEAKTGSFTLTLTNLSVYGLGVYDVHEFRIDFDRNEISAKTTSRYLNVKGNYTLKGRLVLLDLEGSGYAEANVTNAKGTMTFHGTRKQKNGKEYISFETIDYHLDVENGKIRFDDLFRNNPELTKRTNEVLNDNAKEVIEELKPLAEKTAGTVVLSLVKSVFDYFSLDELFI